jgi:hypothetical protein
VLVQRGAVEPGQRPVVAREVRGHPVEDHAQAALVQAVDEGAEIVGLAEARRRGEVPGDLVAPRAAERVLHHRQQLDVREAHVGRVVRELVGQLPVAERAVVVHVPPPRGEMHLVDRDRSGEGVGLRARAHPRVVAPLVLRAVDDRGVLRRDLGRERQRIGLELQLARLRADLVLVVVAVGEAGDEQLPDPRRPEGAHRVEPSVPEVEVADDADRSRRRSPDRERGADDAVDLAHVRAQTLVDPLVPTLGCEVQVELAERRREGVRVLDDEGRALRVADLEPVAERQLGAVELAFEQARGVRSLELDGLGAFDAYLDAFRLGPEGANHDAAVLRVGAEQAVRVGEATLDELVDGAHASSSSRRWIPATGMRTQSGRLSSS